MKRYIKCLFVVGLVLCMALGQSVLAATTPNRGVSQGNGSSNNAQLDAVLVIDASGSMQQTDPNKLGLEGVKLFVDMLSNSGNQVGIVTYGSEVDQTYPMTEIKTQDDRERMKDFVNSISRELEYTDITAGLGKAVSMLEQRNTAIGGSPIIIVFTDGNNAIGGVKNRTDANIASDLASQIASAEASGYPIYTIGLNDNGKLNEAYLKDISEQTKGLAFATKDPDELPDILTQIFAAYSNLKVQSVPTLVGTGDYEEVIVNIPNDNVLEANIATTSQQAVAFMLEDPTGNAVTIPSSQVSYHEANTYHLLKITRPMSGDWKLYVKGVSGDRINIDLVYNYDLEVEIEPLASTSFNKDDMLDIKAYLGLQGQPIDDDALYQNAEATLILTDENGNQENYDLFTNGHQFEGSCQLKSEGSFRISVLVEESSFQRESSPIQITVGSKAAGNQSASNTKKQQTKLEDKGKLPLLIGVGVLVLLLLVGLVVLLKKLQEAKRPLVGQMVVEIKDNTTGKLTPPQYKKLNIFQGKVSVHALLQFAPEYKEAEKIILKSRPNDKVILINQSAYTVEKSGRAVKMENGLELKKGDRLSINMADCGVTIQLEYLL